MRPRPFYFWASPQQEREAAQNVRSCSAEHTQASVDPHVGVDVRRRAMTSEAMLAALLVENAKKCDPPLPEDEVRTIAASVGRYEPAEDCTTGVRLGDFDAYMPTHSYIFCAVGGDVAGE